jgi:hypothetical protein
MRVSFFAIRPPVYAIHDVADKLFVGNSFHQLGVNLNGKKRKKNEKLKK